MVRRIIEINQDACNGCGLCAQACHEGAIAMVDGKATLLRDDYCDGLGDCLPAGPTGAISFVEREAAAYDQQAVDRHKASIEPLACGCPGSQSKTISRKEQQSQEEEKQKTQEKEVEQKQDEQTQQQPKKASKAKEV